MDANTSIEGNGKKELPVTQTNDADKLLDKYFEEYVNGYDEIDFDQSNNDNFIKIGENDEYEYVLSDHVLTFATAKEQSIKTLGGDDNENGQEFISNIEVFASGKNDFVQEDIKKGVGLNTKQADLDKVKAKAETIRKKDAEKKRNKSKETADGGVGRE